MQPLRVIESGKREAPLRVALFHRQRRRVGVLHEPMSHAQGPLPRISVPVSDRVRNDGRKGPPPERCSKTILRLDFDARGKEPHRRRRRPRHFLPRNVSYYFVPRRCPPSRDVEQQRGGSNSGASHVRVLLLLFIGFMTMKRSVYKTLPIFMQRMHTLASITVGSGGDYLCW